MYCLLLQLLYPLGDNSPIAGFLKNKPDGGIHHVCIEVNLKIYEQNGRARGLGGWAVQVFAQSVRWHR